MHAGSFERDIANLSEKLAQNPTSRLFAPLADAYRKAGRVSEAIEICQRGLRHHPDYVSGQMVLARCYHDNGELELAAGFFHQVLRSDPQNLVGLRALGEISEQRDDFDSAAAWYRKALEIDPTNLEMQERLETLSASRAGAAAREFGFGEEREPAEELSPLRDEEPGAGPEGRVPGEEVAAAAGPEAAEDEIATVTLAEIYVEQGLHDRALGIYRRILAEDPRNALIREKAERLARAIAGELERVDSEAGSSLGGFVPGELQVTGDEVIAGEELEEVAGVSDAAPGGPAPESAPGEPAFETDFQSGRMEDSRRRAEPWAFLLVDEADQDPDEVFGPAGAVGSSGHDGGIRDTVLSDELFPGEGMPEAGHPKEGSPLEDEDLQKFQEWLRSLK
jgi:tetratricopeptide (TPR) repeat protein